MRKRLFAIVLLSLLTAGATLVLLYPSLYDQLQQRAGARRPPDSRIADAQIMEAYGKLPLSFEANQGQTDPEVKFLSHGTPYSLFLTATEAVLAFNPSRDREGAVVRMKLTGANPSPRVEGADELPGKTNYFIGNDPSKWRTNVPTYAKVKYKGVYPGIDLVYYGNQQQLEYDFIVAPGADPRAIRLAIGKDEKLRIDGDEDLVLDAEGIELRLHQPVIYQEISGARQRVDGNFVIQGERQVGFEVAPYDASKPLIIDPVLSYSTYLGGSSDDSGAGIAVDSSGNAYVTGDTLSSDFPRANAFQAVKGGSTTDVFVTKLNAAGSALIYSTYVGGSASDGGRGIAVDSSGNVHVTGFTQSTNFPTANALQTAYGGGINDAFVTKLNAAGSALVYSTYLGGNFGDVGAGIAVDSAGNAYVTGNTTSANFPTANALQAAFGVGYDAFVTKLNATGSALLYSTYLGGSDTDAGIGIAVDSAGNAYVTGATYSTNFPTANAFQATYGGNQDAFVAKLNAAGSGLLYSSYLGGSGPNGEGGLGIAVDASGNAFVTGYTISADFPIVNAFQAARGGGPFDAFVTKLNAAGSALLYSTYLGGNGDDRGHGIAVDSSGNAYLTGQTGSTDFPTANAFQAEHGARSGFNTGTGADAFVTKLNAAGSALVYSTYLGGSGGDIASGIVVDSSGNAYVTGFNNSTNFPTANAFQAAFGGGSSDAFVTKFPAVTLGPLPPPQLSQGAVVNGASFAAGAPVAPGSIASAFGTNFATSLTLASTLPLPPSLGGATVKINGVAAPLFAVSPPQINFQIPWETQGQTAASLTVTSGAVTSSAITVNLTSLRPGLFSINQQGTGQGAVLVANTAIIAAPVGTVTGSRPVSRGTESISIYCTGLGPVSNTPASGAAALTSPASNTTTLPTVFIGGVQATVSFSGLAPGFVGLYQVNALVPPTAPTGPAVPVALSIGGIAANSVTIAVQ